MSARSLRFRLALAVLAFPVIAHAQANSAEQIDQVRQEARSHVGPFYATPRIALKELGVDSNVFNAAGRPESDFTATVTPSADIWVPVARRALFQTTVGSDFVWYTNFASERSIDPHLTTRAELYLRRITLFVDGGYRNTRQRLNYEVDLRARHIDQTAEAGVAVRLTPKFSIETAAHFAELRFDGDTSFDGIRLQRTLNQDTRGISVAARHRLTPLTTIALRYEQLEDSFEFSPARDSKSFRVMPGIEFKPRALISGSAYVGYREFTPTTEGALPKFSGLVAQLGLSYTLLGSTTFGVTYSRDLTYSYELLQPFFINNGVGVSVRRALGRRFDVLVSADRFEYVYENLQIQPSAADDPEAAVQVTLPTERRVDRTWNYAGSIGYRVGNGRVGFGVAYWERDSRQKAFHSYDNLRFGTTVTYGF
jgi:putative beta-barrel porin BBP2